MTTRLGSKQKAHLEYLKQYGPYPGNWVAGTPHRTRVVLDQLVAKGLVEVKPEKAMVTHRTFDRYYLVND